MPDPKVNFEPEIHFEPEPTPPIPSALSRFGKGIADFPVSIYHQVDTTGKKASEQIGAGDYLGAFHTLAGIFAAPTDMLRQVSNSPITPEQAKTEGLNQIGGLVGLPMNEAREAYNEGDYARLAGQGVGVIGGMMLPHMVQSKLMNRGAQPIVPEIVDLPVRQPKLLGAGPRFIAGDAGVAENRPYNIDMSSPLPGDMLSGSGTVLPSELGGLHEIPPDLAARRGTQFGKPAYQFDKPFEQPLMKKIKEPVEQMGEHTIDFEPEGAKTEGGIKIGADIESLGKILGKSLYQGGIAKVATKELLQNSLDAVRDLGDAGKVVVDINRPNGYVHVMDNGKGLTKQELETVFTDLGSSGKRDDTNAIGGFGLAKAAPLLGGDKVEVTTTALEADGKRYTHSFSGTPEELLAGVNIDTKPASPNTPTGTSVKTHFAKDSSIYDAKKFIEGLTQNSPTIKATIDVTSRDYNFEKPQLKSYKPTKMMDNAEINTLSSPSADIDIIVPKGTKYGPAQGVSYEITNNGMWQARGHAGSFTDIPGVPEKVIVNIRSKVSEGHADYPFTANREALRGTALEQVEKYINDVIVKPAIGARKAQLTQLYEGLPKVDIGGGRDFYAYDTGNKFTPEEFTEFTSHPIVQAIGSDISNTLYGALVKIANPEWTNKFEKVGFIFDEGLKGIHIPNPGKAKSAILINPFSIMAAKPPDAAAAGILHTILHEIAHIPGGGHDEGFTIRLSEIYEKYGAQAALKAQEKFNETITAGTGEYTPEIQNLLQQYTTARGRASTTEDILGGTGIKSKSESGGKGKIPQGSKSDASRASSKRKPVDSPELQRTREIAGSATQKIVQAINDAVLPREQQEAIYTQERGKRIGKAQKVKETGESGFYKQLGKLKGKMPKVGVEALRPVLNQQEVDSMFDTITNSGLDPWKQINAKRGLLKLLEGGHVPQRNEIKLLSQVFGDELGQTIELHAALFVPPTGKEARIALTNTANATKSLMTSLDVSAPLRQGLPLIGRKEFYSALLPMFKSLVSEESFKASQEALMERPLFDLGEAVDLKLTDLSSDITKREEQFISDLAEKIPYYGQLVRGSNRAYVTFLNKLRADTFDNLIGDAQVITKDADVGLKIANDVAKFVNTSTGRGDLGRFEKYATDLNTVFFSPRMIASRLTMLNPRYYERLNPMVRKEALKALFTVAAAGGIFVGLGVMAGGKTSTDPTSADFMKLRIGNTRLDPYAGFQQYIVAANRLIAAGRAGNDMTGLVNQFTENKLSPMASFIDTLMRGKTAFPPGGLGGALAPATRGTATFNQDRMTAETINRVTPMILGDIIDVAREDPEILPLTIPMGLLGMNSQTYADTQSRRGFQPMGNRRLR